MRKLSLIVVLLSLSFLSNTVFAATPDEAKQFVDSVGKQALETVNSSGSKEEKQQKLHQLFDENVDTAWMAKFVLGRNWQQATEDQRKRYTDAYREFLIAHYTSKFADYNDSNYKITDAHDNGNSEYTVRMDIDAPHSEDKQIQAGYRVHADEGGKFKITDIIVEGVSLINTERSDFGSAVQQKGLDAFIQALGEKAKSQSN